MSGVFVFDDEFDKLCPVPGSLEINEPSSIFAFHSLKANVEKLITDAVSVFKQQPRREASDFVGLPVPHGAASDEVLAPVNVESPIWTAVTSTPRLAAGIDEWSPNGMMTTKNFLLGTLELFEAEASVSHSETQNAPLNEKKKIKSRINLGEIVVSGQSPVRLVSEKPENFTAQSIVVPFTTLNSPRFIVSPISFDGPVTEHSDLSNSIPSCSTSPRPPPAESEIFSNITITRGRQTRPFEDETYVNTEEYFTPMFRRNRPLGQKVRISPPDAALFHRAGYNPVDTIYRNQNFNNRQKREYAKQMILQKARESRADQKSFVTQMNEKFKTLMSEAICEATEDSCEPQEAQSN